MLVKCISKAQILTSNAHKYAVQLGKHWSHSLSVQEDGDIRRITFPRDARGASWQGDALVSFIPEQDVLYCIVEASEPGQLDGLKNAVERHVDRFAFREDKLLYHWTDKLEPDS